jgi:hypothetical protein
MLRHGDASALKLSSSPPPETQGCSQRDKCTQSKRKRYRDRWSSRTAKPALRGAQISEARAAGCVAPRELARGKPSHPLHRRIQTPSPGGSRRMLCSLATRGLRIKTQVHRRTPSAQTPTTDCDCAIALSRVPEQLVETHGDCSGRRTVYWSVRPASDNCHGSILTAHRAVSSYE